MIAQPPVNVESTTGWQATFREPRNVVDAPSAGDELVGQGLAAQPTPTPGTDLAAWVGYSGLEEPDVTRAVVHVDAVQ